jgi:IclR family transcriptional regulator, acetate operon repressor
MAMSRLLKLFEVLSYEAEGLSLADLSSQIGAPKSTLLNSLKPLTSEGFLMTTGPRYRLGPRAFHLASIMMAAWSLHGNIRPFMKSLCDDSGETVALAQLDRDGHRSVFVEVMDSPSSVKFAMQPGRSVELYASASGRVLLAFQPEEYQDDYLAHTKMIRLTDRTVTDPKILKQQLKEVRKKGYWVNIGEAMDDVATIAAPVFAPNGSISAALTVAGPRHRLTLARIGEVKDLLLMTARLASGRPVVTKD